MFDYLIFYFFFFNDTATTEIYTLSLHDALPISHQPHRMVTLLSYNRHTPKASQKKRPRAFRGLRGAAWPSGGHGALALAVGLSLLPLHSLRRIVAMHQPVQQRQHQQGQQRGRQDAR